MPVLPDVTPAVFGQELRIGGNPAGEARLASAAAPMDMSDADLLELGRQQLREQRYEEAVATLQRVDTQAIEDADAESLRQLLSQATGAAQSRREARADFARGEELLGQNQPVEAINAYADAVNNEFADAGTRAKAREQIAVAVAMLEAGGVELPGLYNEAKADYEAERFEAAERKFTALAAAGFNAPPFNRSPGDYLGRIAEETRQRNAPANARGGAPAQQAAPGAEAYARGVEAYEAQNYAAARSAFLESVRAGYQRQAFEVDAVTYLARIDGIMNPQVRDAFAAAPAQQQTTPDTNAGDEATDTPSADEQATDAQATDAQAMAPAGEELAGSQPAGDEPVGDEPAGDAAEGRSVFEQAVAQYRAGEFDAAELNFKRAARMGYQPADPLMDGPVTYLLRIDRLRNEAARPPEAVTVAQVPDDTAANETPAADAQAAQADRSLAAAAEAERLARQQRAEEARRLVDRARQAQQNQQLARATELYAQAIQLDPDNEAAATGYARVLELQGLSPQQPGLADVAGQDFIIQQRLVRDIVDTRLGQATREITQNDFDAARVSVDRALVTVEANQSIFSPQEYQSLRQRIEQSRATLTQAQASFQQQQAAAAREAALRDEDIAVRAADEQRRETLTRLVGQAREFVERQQFREALSTVEQILQIDPSNSYALGVRPLLIDRVNLFEQRNFREQRAIENVRIFTEAIEKEIPYSDPLRYPTDWPDLVERREETVRFERGDSAIDSQLLALLERQLTEEVQFENVSLRNAIQYVRDVSQANIFVNWNALNRDLQITEETPVSLNLRNVTVRTLLTKILESADNRIAFTPDNGVITVSTRDELAENTITQVFDIRDLIIDVPDFTEVPTFDVSQNAQSGGGGGGGGNLFDGGGFADEEDSDAPTRAELVDQIILLIQETIDSNSWRDNGGTIGSLRELNGQLIVTQTPENLTRLSGLLEQLRETRAIQVSIEARFLTVQRNFLEDIGVDFDFAFNLDGTTVADAAAGETGISPIVVDNNTSEFTNASGLSTGVAGSLADSFSTPNLSTQITAFLDDFQANLILRATQAAQNSTQLSAPRVTLFNGQRAFVFVGTFQPYVSDLDPVVGDGAVAQDPQIDTLTSGVILDVQATVSSDRKYVTLTLRPSLNRVVEIETFTIGGNFITGGGVTGGDGGIGVGQPIFSSGFIQQPVVESILIRTTVSVPDGGTLLLGGQTVSAEIERESGVPVLSKVPFLKRLFTNRSMARDEQVLLILVKPTIIIQREVENQQFPLITQN
ncbi:MAG: hypothetical protein ACFCVE_15290 [Phycisphaerae bacterium]